MARKLYIFGIGGTGSRVLKALAMLFASGCKLENNFDVIVPIIIDPDTSNGDLNRTKDILRLYQEIRNQIEQPGDFFKQEIKTINELANNSSVINPDYFQFRLEGVDQSTFGQYIGFDSLNDDFNKSRDDKNFVRLLYSENNLKSDLNVGFKGNPNMGSIVLDQFTNSVNFKKFGQTFSNEDSVFIISSIFGGTGAAGFPLLLKNLRGNNKLPHYAIIRDSKIGGLTYLPYFALNKEGEINSQTFEEKAKIALDYYNRTIIEQRQVNTLYYIGNRGNTNHIEYAVGGKDQKNDAHFLELAGALAIFDFCKNINRTSEFTTVKEYGIENDVESISFNDLNIENAKTISQPLTKFKLFADYLEIGLPKALGISRWTKSDIKLVSKNKNSLLNRNYFNSHEYKIQIEAFNEYYSEWLNEMGRNKPSFNPFEKINWYNAFNLVKGKVPKGKKSYMLLDTENCRLIDSLNSRFSGEKRHTTLIKLFERSTQRILERQKHS